VDLPLSNKSKRVLAYAGEEWEHLAHRHIGTEHLFLGLLRSSFAAHLLNEYGLTIEDARKRVGDSVSKSVLGGDLPGGQSRANLFLPMQIVQLRKFAWREPNQKARPF